MLLTQLVMLCESVPLHATVISGVQLSKGLPQVLFSMPGKGIAQQYAAPELTGSGAARITHTPCQAREGLQTTACGDTATPITASLPGAHLKATMMALMLGDHPE